MKKTTKNLFLAAISLTLSAPLAHAGQTWDGGGTNNNWTSPANWDGNVTASTGLAANFQGEVRTSVNISQTVDTQFTGFNFINDGTAGKTAGFNLSTSLATPPIYTLNGNITTTASSSAITDTIGINMMLNANRVLTTASNHNLTMSGIISQDATNRGFTKQGVGTLTLSNTANTFAGQFLSDAGTVQVTLLSDSGTASSLGAGSSSVRLGSNATATLEYIGTTDSSTNKVYQIGTNTATNTGNATILNNSTSGKLTFTAANFNSNAGGAVTVARTLTLGGSYTGAANEITGIIQDHNTAGGGIVSLTKSGASTWALSGTSTYTGATNVNAGTLVVNGSISTSSLTTISSGATLGGSGTVGDLTVGDGATLAPGNSPGTLNTGTLTLADTSILSFELNPTDTTVGSNINDLISVTGNLTLDGILNVVATSGDFLAATIGTTWRLFNYTGTLTDNGVTLGSMPSLGNVDYFWEIDTSTAGQVNLVVATIPEPGAALLGGLGLLALLRRRRD